jgi:hypothetical protein
MPTNEEISAQRERLAIYRRDLALYLNQRAQYGSALVPPIIENNIHDARSYIHRIKRILREWHVAVEDHPDDDPDSLFNPVAEADLSGAAHATKGDASSADRLAQDLAQRQLDQGSPALSLEELADAFKAASETTIETIVREAERVRTDNWRTDKAKMEQTIPIFRALIQRDDYNHYYHGRLGHALKDSRTPDWAEAQYELSRAIDLRGERYPGKFRFYETNRAICRIMQDPEFQRGQVSRAVAVEFILNDLRAAVQNDPRTKRVLTEDTPIKDWMRINNVSLEQIEQTA